jgi:ubiquinone biosynthesis protein COQ9
VKDLVMRRPVDSEVLKLMLTALPNVAFDGWSNSTFVAACREADISERKARLFCPRGALDLAIAFHKWGDDQFETAFTKKKISELKVREKIRKAVELRIKLASDKEAVRRGVVLFALPIYAFEGSRLIWDTSDLIWELIGDNSEDYNWYSKRAILSAVYASTVLYWLGDNSEGSEETWHFLDRRIEDVMKFETAKVQLKTNKFTKELNGLAEKFLKTIKRPSRNIDPNLPGYLDTYK